MLVLIGCLSVTPAAAQQGIVLEVGTARALPLADETLAAATYAMGGLRGMWGNARGSLAGGAYGGHATGSEGSDFFSGVLGGEVWIGTGGPIGLGLGGTVQGFTVSQPLFYRVTTAELSPMLRVGSRVPLVFRGRFGTGSSRIELHRENGAVRRAEKDLWTSGGDAQVTVGTSALAVTAVAGAERSQGGSFKQLALRAVVGPGAVTLRGQAELWDTPDGREVSGGIAISIGVGRMEARANLDRTGPEPLTLVDPGRQTGAMVGVRLITFEAGRLAVVHEVVRTGRPALVRVRVTPPSAGSVEMLADFTDWAPVTLARDGSSWSAEVEVEPGTYHFGFLVDGEWWVPGGLQGTVPDEWGRMNATMVVPDNEGES